MIGTKSSALLVLCAALVSGAASSSWLELVSPIMTNSEKKLYLSLGATERAKFEDDFWTGKAVTGEEYFKRIQYVDSAFGSSKPGSGANTDPGRVYLALGPPTKVTRLASSRIFVPMEIWYYDIVPGVLNTELRLIFYQKNSFGLPKLYSPTTDTIRALLVPQSSTRTMFGPNDSITEADIRNILKVPPAEDEVVSAAVNVATGIKYSGNDEILGMISSPSNMLRKPPATKVSSRLLLNRPKLDVVMTPSPYGGSQVDLRLDTTAQREVNLEVVQDTITVYQNQLQLKFAKAGPIEYTHRLDLLPGTYQVMFTIDGKAAAYPLTVRPTPEMSEIFRADTSAAVERRQTPFEFDGKQFHLSPSGKYAAVVLARPGKVTWMLRRGAEVLWRSISDGQQFALVELPSGGIAPGGYQLEAVAENASRSADFVLGKEVGTSSDASVISFNANLAPAIRMAFIGHQWLLRGKLTEARKSLDASLEKGATATTLVELARVDVMEGHLDEGRERVRRVLATKPDDFQALSVLAYIEAKFQDYPVAAELYRRALAVQDSPALRVALAQLPKQ
jgi:GWxTD domain-containing protein